MPNTITYFLENRAGNAGTPAAAYKAPYGEMFAIENYLDFTKQSCIVTDIVQALKIPAGFFMVGFKALVLVAEGAGCTAMVGDATADGWMATGALDLNSLSLTVAESSLEATDTYGHGKYYASDDTIDLTIEASTANVAKVWVCAIGYMLERYSN